MELREPSRFRPDNWTDDQKDTKSHWLGKEFLDEDGALHHSEYLSSLPTTNNQHFINLVDGKELISEKILAGHLPLIPINTYTKKRNIGHGDHQPIS